MQRKRVSTVWTELPRSLWDGCLVLCTRAPVKNQPIYSAMRSCKVCPVVRLFAEHSPRNGIVVGATHRASSQDTHSMQIICKLSAILVASIHIRHIQASCAAFQLTFVCVRVGVFVCVRFKCDFCRKTISLLTARVRNPDSMPWRIINTNLLHTIPSNPNHASPPSERAGADMILQIVRSIAV